MIVKRIQEKGLLAKLLEKAIRLLLIKECKKISNLRVEIISSSTQLIKGEIQKINILAEDINYKDLLFDDFELDANQIKLNFNLINKELYIKNNSIVKLKISLSQNSLRTILLSNSWNWIGNIISKEILNQEKLEDITIRDDKLLIKDFENNDNIKKVKQINIKTEKGKVYLSNKNNNKIIQIPMEEKIYVEKISLENNLLTIFANSSISF